MAETYIVDGSVAAKWFLNDEMGTDEARRLARLAIQNECYLIAPAILSYELPNGLLMAARRGRLDETQLGRCVQEFLDLPIGFFLHEGDSATWIMGISAATKLTFYDAAYLALAQTRDGVLAVGDTRLAEAAETMGIRTLRIGI